MTGNKTQSQKTAQGKPFKSGVKDLDNDFESVARRLECDEDKAAFEAKLGKVAKAKSAPKDTIGEKKA